MALPIDLNTLLQRGRCAAALSDAGFPTSAATLATKATRGGGPPFRRFGRVALYRWGDALEWAQSKLGPALSSTSELDARNAIAGAKELGEALRARHANDPVSGGSPQRIANRRRALRGAQSTSEPAAN